ncbi:hypothetical protein RRF57_004531 [Xylaria bambusicola]|uniref:Uncharacterized protein n=1 Tax=Xylaria bambusicola TaxID=326684 RepID=A0AAN7ULZ8_9PEZI
MTDSLKDTPDVRRGANPSQHPAISSERRPTSLPNSVKAFAEPRHRELSMSESKCIGGRGGGGLGRLERLARTTSVGSDPGCHDRPCTTGRDTASLATNRSVEDDGCHSVHKEHPKGRSYIGFDYLEALTPSGKREQPTRRVFYSLQPESPTPHGLPVAPIDGNFIGIPCGKADLVKKEDAAQNLTEAYKGHAEPNRFSFFSSALEFTIHAAEFSDLVLPGEDVRSLLNFPKRDPNGVWWLNVNSPTREEIRTICVAFGIHPLTIEDIATMESREKIELFPSYYFACFRSFKRMEQPDRVNYTPLNVYAVVFREGIISFSFLPNVHASQVWSRIAMLKERISLSSDWICYALIDDIVNSFAPAINRVECEADTIEDQVFIARPNDNQEFVRKIGRARKDVMCLMSLLGGKANVLRVFTKRCSEDYNVTPSIDIGLYLDVIQDHVMTMTNNLAHFERMLARSHANYLAQLSISNIDQGNRTNQFLSRITS